MNACLRAVVSASTVSLCLGLATSAHADPLSLNFTSQNRSLEIRRDLVVTPASGNSVQSHTVYPSTNPALGGWLQTVRTEASGNEAPETGIDLPAGFAVGFGRLHQDSVLTSQGIFFNTDGEVTARAMASTGASARADMTALSVLDVVFDVASAEAMFLRAMAKSNTGGGGVTFDVSLFMDGRLIWSTGHPGPLPQDGGFSLMPQLVSLNPGHQYHLSGTFSLFGFQATGVDPTDVAAQGFAEFSASPAPEPQTWALMLAGLGFIGAAVRRARTGAAA